MEFSHIFILHILYIFQVTCRDGVGALISTVNKFDEVVSDSCRSLSRCSAYYSPQARCGLNEMGTHTALTSQQVKVALRLELIQQVQRNQETFLFIQRTNLLEQKCFQGLTDSDLAREGLLLQNTLCTKLNLCAYLKVFLK